MILVAQQNKIFQNLLLLDPEDEIIVHRCIPQSKTIIIGDCFDVATLIM